MDNTERDAPRSETLVAGLGSVLAILLTERTGVSVCIMTPTLNPDIRVQVRSRGGGADYDEEDSLSVYLLNN